MDFISIQNAINKGEGEVSIRGWVYRERSSNRMAFIVVRDSTNIIQCVVAKNEVDEETWKQAKDAKIETSVEITGTLKKDDRAPTGYELIVSTINTVGVSNNFPITKDQSTEFLLDKRHLWIRSRKLTAVMKVRSTVMAAIREFFQKKKFYEMAPPIFTPNACEGGSTLFQVKYFDDICYLTQSWQLYAEAAIFSLENIYCISPCFRAEKSKTSRHLAEFWMAEAEMAWYDLKKTTDLATELVAYIIKRVIEQNKDELNFLGQDISKLQQITYPFPTITYTEALKILKEKEGMDVPWGKDLRTVEEDRLMNSFNKPVIVTHYPKEIMAFYKPADPTDATLALCFDMIAPEGYGEIIGGSQRSNNVEEMKKQLKKEGENLEHYEWYFDLRKYGSIPHSGFGLGVERVVAWLCKLDNIKDAIPFPRTMIRKTP